MIKINIFEAKAKLSEYLERVAAGERVVICKRNHPVAELRPIEGTRTSPRPIGRAKGQITVPPSFFDPLPDEIVDSFYAVADGSGRGVSVAEERASYGRKAPTTRRSLPTRGRQR